MTEIDYIRSELEKIEKKEDELEKYVRLSIFFDRASRKAEKTFLKKNFSDLKKLKKSIKEDKTFLAEEKKEIEAKLETENLSEEDKEELIAELQKIA